MQPRCAMRFESHAPKSLAMRKSLGGRFGYFLFFSARGGGRGSRGAGGRWGIGFLLKSPGGGPPGREGPRGREGVCSELGNFWGGGGGGGAKYFFSGPKCPPRSFFASAAKTHSLDLKSQENARKTFCEKSCDVGLRCEKLACFLRSSNAKCLRFGLPLRFGLRCEYPRCQIASDAGRAMRTTKQGSIPVYTKILLIGAPDVLKHLKTRYSPVKRDWHEFG